MQLTTTLLTATTLLTTTAFAQIPSIPSANETQFYRLKTCLLPGQEDKAAFEGLYLQSYHTGAGLSDATLSTTNASEAAAAYLSPLTQNQTSNTNSDLSNLLLDLGNPYPWSLLPRPNTVPYSQWQPVRINVGERPLPDNTGFWLNEAGLQWSGREFDGWRVCEWWHGVPQLFFKVVGFSGSEASRPESCADVRLMPEVV